MNSETIVSLMATMIVFARALSRTPRIRTPATASTITTAGTLNFPPSPGALAIGAGSFQPNRSSIRSLKYWPQPTAIAVGWGQYFNDLIDDLFGWKLPAPIASAPGDGGKFNVPAVVIVLAVAGVLILGVRESARANTIMVAIKLTIVSLFIVIAATGFSSDNLHPFTPNGFDGVVTAASVIFFAYIGFDAISTSGEEVKNPGRGLPIAIIASLAICTLLYILVSTSAVGAMPFKDLDGQEAPLAVVLKTLGFDWGATVISFGALIAITSVVLTVLYGQTRIMFAMCRDG